jgi:uncharacterized protein with FMN-binding domain
VNTRTTLGSIFASISVLAIGWQLGAAGVTPASITSAVTGASGTAGTTGATGTGTGTGTATTTAPVTATPASTDGVYTGSDVQTRFGSVQVQVTIAAGTITEVTPLQLTDVDRRSVQISNQAAPMLRQEVLAAQSAQVSTIGGATYTSEGYLSSLQSALDQAGL